MANEIDITIRARASKNGATIDFEHAYRSSMTGNELLNATQVIGTTAETLNLGEIASAPAFIAIKNLDTANFVEIGGDSGLTVFKLRIPAGKSQIISPTTATLYAKADTASVRVQILAASA